VALVVYAQHHHTPLRCATSASQITNGLPAVFLCALYSFARSYSRQSWFLTDCVDRESRYKATPPPGYSGSVRSDVRVRVHCTHYSRKELAAVLGSSHGALRLAPRSMCGTFIALFRVMKSAVVRSILNITSMTMTCRTGDGRPQSPQSLLFWFGFGTSVAKSFSPICLHSGTWNLWPAASITNSSVVPAPSVLPSSSSGIAIRAACTSS
jgi:hypothetical protein